MEFQKEELEEILNIFQQESSEIISSMDDKLLKLENNPNDSELAMQLFRDAHSLKGSARMLGFCDIQNIAHKIEDIINFVKEYGMKLETSTTDTISEALSFISFLINETVKLKEEFKSDKTEKFIEKLTNIAQKMEEKRVSELNSSSNDNSKNPEVDEFLKIFPKIEDLIIDILSIVSLARQKGDFSDIRLIEEKINSFNLIVSDFNYEEFSSIKNLAQNVLNSLDKFKLADNKELGFLDVNNVVVALIEAIEHYANKLKIEKKNYYDIVEKKLDEEKRGVVELQSVKNEKVEEILQRVPLLELNIDFFADILDLIDDTISKETNKILKEIYLNVKEIINVYKRKSSVLGHDGTLGIVEILNLVKINTKPSLEEAKIKSQVIKTMIQFQNKEHSSSSKHKESLSQREILNTITNTEIKTLRVDSAKLDNLVGQIGELIVSKIKTNEQLSFAKKINSEVIEWQKNFVKMSYYIKYFDKKYLSGARTTELPDFRKIIAYNKQLCSLVDMHGEKINTLIKDINYLFRQIQESETKLNTTTTEIETMVKNMRILPLSTIFQLFPRMVHNIARDKNKKIELTIEGGDISADKTIIEEIKIPLMHIIRNSIDHGIEDVETRRKLNKNPIGKIEIIASYMDNKVVIDVKDDGRGLDIEKIKQKALEKNILLKEELDAISDEELTNLIFYPGFSTENFVTELSGRGLGLDIVNTKINQLQGRVDIFSQLNEGTVVRIILPAPVATKKVFVIEEQKQLYAIETSVIRTITRINADDIFEKDNNNYFIYDGNAIPIYTLSQILNLENAPRSASKYTLLIIETENVSFGVIVEKLISDQEIVHKKFSPPLYKVKHISGITTLANGEACLIINVSDIISTINSKKIRSRILLTNELNKAKDNFKYKILVVDDSHTTRMLQKNILSNCGYNVSVVTGPKNALEKMEKTKYDLIITDVQMPEMNGFEFICEFRKMSQYEQAPVIVVSSEPKEKHLKEIQTTKPVAYIQKNLFKQEELIHEVEKILNY